MAAWGNALAVAITISANTNWSAINTGSGVGGQPNNSDTITISGNTQLTVDVANGAVSAITIGSANTSGARLVFNSNSLVTVSGNVQFGNGGGNRNGSIDMTNGGTLSAGSFSISNLNAWTPGAGTVILTGTNTIPNNVGFATFNNLTIAANTTTLSRATTVSGNLQVDGILAGAQTLTLSGTNKTIDGAGTVSNTGTFNITTGAKSVPATADLTIAGTILITGAITVTNNGTVTSTGAGGILGTVAGSTWLNANGSRFNVAGTVFNPTGTLNASTSANIVDYNGAAQTVKATAYDTLRLSTSGAKTMTGVTSIGADLTISGTATMTSNAGFTVGGTFNYDSTGSSTLTAATAISIGKFSQTAGTLVDNGNTITVTGTGANTWQKTGGTFTATGTANFTGAAPEIGASNFGTLQISVGSGNTATLTGTVTPSLNLTVSSGTFDWSTFNAARTAAGGTLTVSNGATLKIGGTNIPSPNNSNYTTHTLGATSTIEFSGTTQNVFNEGGSGYGHLTLSGSGTKTLVGASTVRGNLTIGSGVTFAGTTFALTVNGNVSNSGTHTGTSGSILLSGGSAAHALSGTGTYANLELNDANGATLNASPTVSGVLTFTNGVITTSANTMITSGFCPGSVSRASGHVNGNLQLRFNTGAQTCTFHVGDSASANYTPVAVSFSNVSVAGGLIGLTTSGDYVDTGTLINNSKNVGRSWTLSTPGSGALSSAGTYDTTFTYLVADNDAGTTPSLYVVENGTSCSPSCTWTLPTVSGTPTTTTATATGMSTFGVLAVGEHLATNILVTVPSSPVNTCSAQGIQITVRDAANNTVPQYRGLVNLSTSTSHGDWSGTLNGTLTNGTADDGAATYQFVAADNGVVTVNLTSNHADALTITATDSVTSSITGTSSSLTYAGSSFAITNDTVQVAGKNQAMTVVMNGSGSCTNPLTGYNGAKNLKAWLTRDGTNDPGGAAPTIGALSLPNAVPGANNLSLTFTNGSASFNLGSTDVGKYVLNIRDDSRSFSANVDINGASSAITTRPFALVVDGIKKVTTNNPGGTASTGSGFIAAGSTFEATVKAYRWNAAADANADGVPDGGASLADIILNGATVSYAWTTTLSRDAITPVGGVNGTLSNGSLTSFSNGVANPTNLAYNEVGSFTLGVSATGFLGTSGVDLTTANGIAIVFNSSGARSTEIGRFFPDHFTLVAGSTVTPACVGGGFTYMGHGALGYSFSIEARNVGNTKTNNYRSADYLVGVVDLEAENNDNGTPLTSRITVPGGSWVSGAYSVTKTDATFSRNATPDGSYESLVIGVKVTDNDGPVLAGRDMNASTPGCGGGCTAQSIGSATKVRFGRLREQNAVASSGALVLPVPVALQYWDGTVFKTNTDDTCTSIASASVTLNSASLSGGSTSVLNNPITFASGTGFIRLDKPGVGANGFVLVTPTVPSYLQGNWTGGTWDQNPSARASWGVFGSQPRNFVFQRENY